MTSQNILLLDVRYLISEFDRDSLTAFQRTKVGGFKGKPWHSHLCNQNRTVKLVKAENKQFM